MGEAKHLQCELNKVKYKQCNRWTAYLKEIKMQRLIKELDSFVPENEIQAKDIESFKQGLEIFKERFFDRENLSAHITPTVWVTNPERTKSLLAFHNMIGFFAWFGGHSDNDMDSVAVAKKEMIEESNISNFKILNNEKPIDFFVHNVNPHIKKGSPVPDHLHYCPVYLFEVSESEEFKIAAEENSAIKWIDNKNVLNSVDSKSKIVYGRILKNLNKF